MFETAFNNLVRSIQRYGVCQSFLSLGLLTLARLINFELCRLCMPSGKPYDFAPTEVCTCDVVEDWIAFHQHLHEALSHVDYQWAFARGDHCVANFDNGTIVAYSFSSSLPTRVEKGVEFFFPEWCIYGYAANTVPAYRGMRLSMDRWRVGREFANKKHGHIPRSIYYYNVSNSASLKSDKADGIESIRLGYSLYVRWRDHTYCWNSRGARRFGVGFRALRAGGESSVTM